jgi:hypothetical protein
MNIMTLNFIKDDGSANKQTKKIPIKKMSKNKKRQIKRLRKIKKNKMVFDNDINIEKTQNFI